ncbi:unnamed protein product [Prunus brigantina]
MVKNNNVASGSRVLAVWNNQNTTIFCDLCIKEVEAGNRLGTHFKKEGWENVRISLSKETGAEYDKSQLKNKWDALKEQWKIWKELIGKETGLGWNSKLGTIDASDEWWHNKIEKKWSILRDMPNYPFDKQVKIVIATMALHNYIRRHAQRDIHFDKVNDNPNAMEMEGDTQEEYHIIQGPGAQELETLRNKIAASLMHASS